MANNTNLPRNADTAAGGKWIKELIPKSMASIMQIAYVAIIPAPHHHPLRPVSCRRLESSEGTLAKISCLA